MHSLAMEILHSFKMVHFQAMIKYIVGQLPVVKALPNLRRL